MGPGAGGGGTAGGLRLLAGFPYLEVAFDAAGLPADRVAMEAAVEAAAGAPVTDVMLLAHGWNNDVPAARALYQDLADSMRQVLPLAADLTGRQVMLVGLLWPSQRFAMGHDHGWHDDDGAAGPAGRAGTHRWSRGARAAEVGASLARFAHAVGPQPTGLDEMGRLVPNLERSAAARAEFVAGVRAAVGGEAGAGAPAEPDDGAAVVLATDAEALIGGLSADVGLPPSGTAGAGPGAAVGNVPGRYARAAVRLLNYATYAVVRRRAAAVGVRGAAPMLASLRAHRPDLRLHLVGHSFGGRLVTAAGSGLGGQSPAQVESVALLQAAFSQYGLAPRWDGRHDGAFRPLLSEQRVRGPVLVTHTRNDRAVGYPYAMASLVLRHAGVALGGPDSRYGAIGRNGARRTPEAVDRALLEVGRTYRWDTGRVHNLRADVISGHGDVARPEVAHALLQAVSAT